MFDNHMNLFFMINLFTRDVGFIYHYLYLWKVYCLFIDIQYLKF